MSRHALGPAGLICCLVATLLSACGGGGGELPLSNAAAQSAAPAATGVASVATATTAVTVAELGISEAEALDGAFEDSEIDIANDIDSEPAPSSGRAMALGVTSASVPMSAVALLSANEQNTSHEQGQPTDPVISMEDGVSLIEDHATQTAKLVAPAMSSNGTDFGVDPGRLTVAYQGGDASEREAFIGRDPVNASNRVLSFLLRSANVREGGAAAKKGRVQLNAYSKNSVRARELRLRARMFLSPDIDLLRTYPRTISWLTISEWWNNAGWTGQEFPFRITVDVTKPLAAVGAPLHFTVRAETKSVSLNRWDTKVWTMANTSVPVPVGQWVTLEYSCREGDAQHGRFYMALQPDGGERVVIFDHRGWTHHPSDTAPDGFTHLNPLKLYTSKALIDHVRNAGGSLAVHWDDIGFRLCRNHAASGLSPCAPESFL